MFGKKKIEKQLREAEATLRTVTNALKMAREGVGRSVALKVIEDYWREKERAARNDGYYNT